MEDTERGAAGMAVRREVLGDEHVDRAMAGATPFTAPFQDFITRYAWGEIWSRPGLSRAERSIITLTALAILRQEDELAPLARVPEEQLDVLEDELALRHRQGREQRPDRPGPHSAADEPLRSLEQPQEPLEVKPIEITPLEPLDASVADTDSGSSLH